MRESCKVIHFCKYLMQSTDEFVGVAVEERMQLVVLYCRKHIVVQMSDDKWRHEVNHFRLQLGQITAFECLEM